MPSLCCSITSVTIGTIFLIFGIIVAVLFDPFINSQIDKELVLHNDNSSETFKLWLNPPIVPYLKIYFFNVTNVEAFMSKKEKPNLVEVGPYSYREEWHKIDVKFHNNGTVTYQTKKLYFFDPENSVGPESDLITTLNIPVNVAVDKVSTMGRLVQLAMSSMLEVLNEAAFTRKSVRDLVWGYDDQLIDLSKKFLPKNEQLPFDKFGYFYQRNGSTDGIFNVFTGNLSMSNYTIIDTFNYTKELKYWKTAECNRINGTDGTSYPPRLSKDDVLYMFNENLCRSLPLVYNNTLKHQGINAWRFVPPADVYANVSTKPENKCFCVRGPPCIGGGVFDISPCKFNVSSVLSWPHFYQADEKYLNAVTGLKPDPQKHSLFIDVNPTLGMPLSAEARIQINFVTKGLPTIKPVANLPNMVFPVLWFEDGVRSLPPNVITLLEKSTFYPKVAVDKVSTMGRLVQLAMSSMLEVLKEAAFTRKSVRDLVWGYDDQLIDLSKKFLPKNEQLPFDKFGYFYQRNGSTDGIFNVFTGNLSMSNYTIIDTFNYTKELKYWKTAECNRINGTDGTSYPPRLSKDDVLYMFNENLCRSLPLVYNNTLKHQGINAWRFVPPADVYANVSTKPENKCFCVRGPPCIGGGVFDISPCKFNVSSVLSWPHFYQADEKYLNAVTGLKPDPLKHSLFIDVNPTLGMPLSAEARIQINFVTKGLPTIKPVANLPNMVFPVLWFEDGVRSLPPNVIALLEKSTFYPKVAKISILTVIFVLGSILFLFGLIALIYYLKRVRQSKVFTTKETSNGSTPITGSVGSAGSGYSNPAVSTDNPDYVGL
ncbi:UNVERIFIED_CONTAM: hypothetical protein RMT77_016106 [Armadillidium vulgare]